MIGADSASCGATWKASWKESHEFLRATGRRRGWFAAWPKAGIDSDAENFATRYLAHHWGALWWAPHPDRAEIVPNQPN